MYFHYALWQSAREVVKITRKDLIIAVLATFWPAHLRSLRIHTSLGFSAFYYDLALFGVHFNSVTRVNGSERISF